jgi:hypothetical protein
MHRRHGKMPHTRQFEQKHRLSYTVVQAHGCARTDVACPLPHVSAMHFQHPGMSLPQTRKAF